VERTMPHEGERAPDFELPTASGEKLRLSGLKGKTVVLYFYPKDDTSGCTLEAKDFSSFAADFRKAGVEVVGLSPDSVQSHQKFIKKYSLAVRLAADEDNAVATAYGVWVEKSMYGRKFMGVERSTFLIDKTGRIARSWRKVRVPGHAEEVLAAARALAK
jgi:peroxiredoxin Q/BCP